MKLPEDTFVCNCCQCGSLLIGQKSRPWHEKLSAEVKKAYPLIAGRIQGRPYCGGCLYRREQRDRKRSRRAVSVESSGWQDNMIRAIEGG